MNTETTAQAQANVSVIIPVFNGGEDLEKCLAAVAASSYPVLECIVVDDASTDGMVIPAAERHGARVIRLDKQCGPAQARNHGVEQARGEILFFTDADVLLHTDALELAVNALQSDTSLSAVFGSYDDQPGHASFISQYRNLFHHWVHQSGADEATTFWTGCGAIWRNIFVEMGGFNRDFRRPSIEDIELGSRLSKSGHNIRLLKNMMGKHQKHWQLWNLVKTDIFQRGVPWMLLVLREGKAGKSLNLDYKSRIATVLAGLFGLSLLVLALSGHVSATLPALAFLLTAAIGTRLSGTGINRRNKTLLTLVPALLAPLLCYLLLPDPLALIPLMLVLAIIASHLKFYRYIADKRSGAFAIASAPMQVLFFICCAISIPIGFITHHHDKRLT